MTKPEVKWFSADDVLKADAALRLLTEGDDGGVWGLFDRILAQERQDKVEVALFDEGNSKKFYAGYITAIDMLRGMPHLIMQMADDVRAKRDAEAKQQVKSRRQLPAELVGNEETEASVL